MDNVGLVTNTGTGGWQGLKHWVEDFKALR